MTDLKQTSLTSNDLKLFETFALFLSEESWACQNITFNKIMMTNARLYFLLIGRMMVYSVVDAEGEGLKGNRKL